MTPPDGAIGNTVHPLRSIDLSVICSVFVHSSFLKNQVKTPGNLLLTEGHMTNMLFTNNEFTGTITTSVGIISKIKKIDFTTKQLPGLIPPIILEAQYIGSIKL